MRQQLSSLEERGLVRFLGDDQTRRFRFKHALVQEATYDSILLSRRAELHRDVGEAIRELFVERDASMCLTLAEHWLKAHAYEDMLSELSPRALELISGGHGAALLELLENLTPNQFEDPGRLNEMGRMFYHLSDLQKSLEFNRASLELAEANNDIPAQAKATSGIGLAYWSFSEYANAQLFLEKSRDLSTRLEDDFTLANVEFNLANVLRDRGEYARAIAAAEHALELYLKLDSKVHLANTYLILGTCYFSAGDSNRAASFYSYALESSQELGDVRGQAVGLCNLAELEETLGDYSASRAHFEQAIQKADLLMNGYLLSFAKGGLAQVQLEQGQSDSALENAESALEIGDRIQSDERRGAAHRVLAEIRAALGDEAQALIEARLAVDLLEHVGHDLELRRARATYRRILAANSKEDSPGLDEKLKRAQPGG